MSNKVEEHKEVPIGTFISEKTNTQNNMGQTYSQWAIGQNGKYFPTFLTAKHVEAGIYRIFYSNTDQAVCVQKSDVNIDDLFMLPTSQHESILKDLKSFWNSIDIFTKFGFVHKRGILLHGDPGCGKSALIQLIMNSVINDYDGIIFNICDRDDLEYFIDYIPIVRAIEPIRPIVVIMEDIDEIMGDSGFAISQVLNLLDGVKQINNVVYLATTNYPEKLSERISNRPSRFDRKYHVEIPNDKVRKAFFEHKLDKDFKDLDIWVADSKGLSLAHCKEMIISTILLQNSYTDTLAQLGVLKSTRKRVAGFNSTETKT